MLRSCRLLEPCSRHASASASGRCSMLNQARQAHHTHRRYTALTATSAAATTAAMHTQPAQGCQAAVVEWQGLHTWRESKVDNRLVWGNTDAQEPQQLEPRANVDALLTPQLIPEEQLPPLADSLLETGMQVLSTASPAAKAALTQRAWRTYCAGGLPLHSPQQHPGVPYTMPDAPARPSKPKLVSTREIPNPGDPHGLPVTAHLMHTLAHIELNALDLAWDTAVRFAQLRLPDMFYEDFVRVAADESRHLGWCMQRLAEQGRAYGDIPAHNVLWDGCRASACDLNARLALIPMAQEARGLDAGMRLVQRLLGVGDKRSSAIVMRIAQEERAHVAVGVAWFTRVCAALGREPGDTFRAWLNRLSPDMLKAPFNHAERQLVGLQQDWYDTTLWPQGAKLHSQTSRSQHSSHQAARTKQQHVKEKTRHAVTTVEQALPMQAIAVEAVLLSNEMTRVHACQADTSHDQPRGNCCLLNSDTQQVVYDEDSALALTHAELVMLSSQLLKLLELDTAL